MSSCATCGGNGWIWVASLDPDDGGKDVCPEPDCSHWSEVRNNKRGQR